MTLLFRCLSVLPLWLLHAMGYALGWVAYLGSGVYRSRFVSNAQQAGYSAGQVRAAIGHAGRMTAEVPRLWMGARVPLQWVNAPEVGALYQAGKGVLFLTPHIGSFEVTAQAWSERYAPQLGDITVLYRPARKAWLARLIALSRNRPGVVAVPTTLSGVKQLIKSLKSGRAVFLLPDQVPPEGLGMWSPFFGRDAYTMTLAARLAQQTAATVFLLWGERLPWARGYRLHFSALKEPLPDDLPQAVAQINCAMEDLIRQCPTQYLWGYARYKQPQAMAHTSAHSAAAAPAKDAL